MSRITYVLNTIGALQILTDAELTND